MDDGNIWVTFERGENQGWDPSRMHRERNSAECPVC
jgi:hypothetical protein